MISRLRDTVALSLLTLGVGAGAAQAESSEAIGLSLNINHGASVAGQPRVLTSTGGALVPAGPVTVYNFRTPFASPFYNGSVRIGANTPFTPSPPATLEPAQTAYSFSDSFFYSSTIDLIGALQDSLNDSSAAILSDYDYVDHCFQWAGPSQTNWGLPANTNVQLCDAIDASFKVGGATFKLTAAENNPNFTFAIPEVGYSFTSGGSTGPIFLRGDGLEAVTDNFLASGKEVEVSKLLLGVQTLPARGALPTTGKFFAFSGTVSRSALQGRPAASFQKSFGFNSLAEIIGYGLVNRNATLADFGLAGFTYNSDCYRPSPNAAVTGQCDAINANITLLGVSASLAGAENNPDLSFAVPAVGYSRTTSGSVDRDDALEDAISGIDEDTLGDIFSKMLAAYAATQPDSALVGNPQSLQGSVTRALLDLDAPSDLLDERVTDGRQTDPSGWMIGGRVGTYSALNSEATFFDGVVERSFRAGESRRSLIKVSAPFNFTSYDESDVQTTASARVAYEMPLIDRKWVIEPSAGAGYVFKTGSLDAGALYFAGISSRFKIAPVGRGHIVIGNAIGYTSTIEIDAGNGYKTPEIANTSFRNGIAYQLPVGQRIFGRLGTLRASYTYTYLAGDELFLDRYHDVSLSYGMGSRDVSARQLADAMRIGVSATVGEDYEAFSLNLGFRF